MFTLSEHAFINISLVILMATFVNKFRGLPPLVLATLDFFFEFI